MIKWLNVLQYASLGNLKPDFRIEKSEEQWREMFTPEQFAVMRLKDTERPHSSTLCSLFEPGAYACAGCGTQLFDSYSKYQSNTGWPSFTQPVKDNVIAYHKDTTYEMSRIEVTCNVCDSHLGHVFPDGPEPSGLRYCINAVSLTKIASHQKKITFGGGCFWCTEAIFNEIKGVIEVESGYSGGEAINPSYKDVCTGATGHAEVIEITYDSSQIDLKGLVKIHLTTHNPTTLNQQGADKGTQYRSIVFYRNEDERMQIVETIEEVQGYLDEPITTEVKQFEKFYPAEDHHQTYYASNPGKPYCQTVIEPKLNKLRQQHSAHLKTKLI